MSALVVAVQRWLAVVLTLVVGAAGPAVRQAPAVAHPPPGRLMTGADVSWPDCPAGEGIPSRRSKGEPMPRRDAQFVVVGLTNGPGFTPNPCLGPQLSWVRAHGMRVAPYAMTTYPTRADVAAYGGTGPWSPTTLLGRLRNTGHAEATYAAGLLATQGVAAPMVWVDVEPYPVAPWSSSARRNRAVVAGVVRGYRDAKLAVGLYTYANGWRAVTAGWRLASLPAWSTVGHRGRRAALATCAARGPAGGPVWVAQWYDAHRDYDVTCPRPRPEPLFAPDAGVGSHPSRG